MGLFRNKINNYSELSTELKESNVNFDKIYDDCVEHFTTVKAGDLNKVRHTSLNSLLISFDFLYDLYSSTNKVTINRLYNNKNINSILPHPSKSIKNFMILKRLFFIFIYIFQTIYCSCITYSTLNL